MPRHPRHPGATAVLAVLVLAVAGLVRGQSAPPILPPAAAPAAEPAAPVARVAPIPGCDAVMVISRSKCQFAAVTDDIARVTVGRPLATVIETANGTTLRSVPFAGNGLRQLLEGTFPRDPAKPTSYAAPIPVVSVIVGSGRRAVSAEARLVPSRQFSIESEKQPQRYMLQVQRGPGNDDFAALSAGKCKVYVAAPCAEGCPVGEADFGSGCKAACPAGLSDFGAGCVNATATTAVCPSGEAKFGDSATCAAATPTADVCPEGEASFGSGCVDATDSAEVCSNDEAKFGNSTTCVAATPTVDVCPEGEASFGSSGCVDVTDSAEVCSNGEAKFGNSTTCVAATPTADVCPDGQANFGSGCEAATATTAVCPSGEAKFGDSSTCAAATPTADVYLSRDNICDPTALTDATQTALCLAVANPTASECPCGTPGTEVPDLGPPPPLDGDGDYPDGCLCDGCCG